MRGLLYMVMIFAGIMLPTGCGPETKVKDRSAAHDMFQQIVSLTKSYINKVEAAADSAAWENVCMEYEDSLDRINFAYPADTDLLLSEGQNDTIMMLTEKYVRARDKRIQSILHPVVVNDTVDTISNANAEAL